MHLALGNGEFAPFRVADFAAYERRIRSYLEDFLLEEVGDYPGVEPYPEPVEHCAICRWSTTCIAETARRRRPVTHRRHADDAACCPQGCGRQSRGRQFAELKTLPDLEGANPDSLRVRSFRHGSR